MPSRAAHYHWLPGRLRLTRGAVADYRALARFHYCAGAPASFALILTVHYVERRRPPRVVAVGVLSHPPLRSHARESALGWQALPQRERWQRANAELRTISRIIVHPQFRGIGLAEHLARTLAALARTPRVETTARMARFHPFFRRAGFTAHRDHYLLKQFAPAPAMLGGGSGAWEAARGFLKHHASALHSTSRAGVEAPLCHNRQPYV
jgi:GNAT superfamily N-acetyltransferase